MKFLNYPSESPFQQHILSRLWTNLLREVLDFDEPLEIGLGPGMRRQITNVATEKVGENLEYGIELTIRWWEWEDEPIWYLQPFARTFLPTGGTKVLRIGSGAIKISKGHRIPHVIVLSESSPLEALEILARRISHIERNKESE